MNLFNPTALLKDKDKIWIQFYTLPEPEINPIQTYASRCYDYDESKVSYPLKDECKEEFIKSLYSIDTNWIKSPRSFGFALEKGISIDSIKERIEIKYLPCGKNICPRLVECQGGCVGLACAILLPIQVEEKETQGEIMQKQIKDLKESVERWKKLYYPPLINLQRLWKVGTNLTKT